MPQQAPTRSVRMFDVNGAADRIGCARESARRWAQSGALRGFRDRLAAGGPWRFTEEDVEAFVASRQQINQPLAVASGTSQEG